MPLGNAFVKPTDFEKEKRFPLKLGFCESCFMVQQIEPPPLESLRSDYENYAYVPFGTTLENHYKATGLNLAESLSLRKGSFVLDIGSNSGILLQSIRQASGAKILGVEPAIRISQMARDSGVPTITDFFKPEVVAQIIRLHGRADLVTVTQVLQHIPNIEAFLDDIRAVMKLDGTLVIEGRYFAETVKKRSWDTIYHEMIWFFTLHSLIILLLAHGFHVFKAEKNEIYGGSLRLYASNSFRVQEESVTRILEEEKSIGLAGIMAYKDFATDTLRLRDELSELVMALRKDGKRIAGYGAPSTSTTLLNFCRLTSNEIMFIVDDNQLKQEKFTPGSHIPIVNSNVLSVNSPDYLLILAWRLSSEIITKLESQRAKGTKLIMPLPKIEVV